MATVTITFQDNPLAGRPGQTDITIIVGSVDPPMPMPPGEDTVSQLSDAQMAAIAAISHVTAMSYESTWLTLDEGTGN